MSTTLRIRLVAMALSLVVLALRLYQIADYTAFQGVDALVHGSTRWRRPCSRPRWSESDGALPLQSAMRQRYGGITTVNSTLRVRLARLASGRFNECSTQP